MSATSPDSGLSGPHTSPRAPAPPAKSSLVGKVYKYSQYQKFSNEETFLQGDFDKSKFLELLNVELPKSIPDVPSRGKESFLTLANKVAKYIKGQHEHYLFLYLAFLPTYDFHFRFPRSRNSRV
jgi:hypothetical protein